MSARRMHPEAARYTPSRGPQQTPPVLDRLRPQAKTPEKNQQKAPGLAIKSAAKPAVGLIGHRIADRERARAGKPAPRGIGKRAVGPICANCLTQFSGKWNSLPVAPRAEEFVRDLLGRHSEEAEQKT